MIGVRGEEIIIMHLRYIITLLELLVQRGRYEGELVEVNGIIALCIHNPDCLSERLIWIRSLANFIGVMVDEPISVNCGRKPLLYLQLTK